MAVIEHLLKDRELVESIIQRSEFGYSLPEFALESSLTVEDLKRFLQLALDQGRDAARSNYSGAKADTLEKVVLIEGRPAILIKNNTFTSPETKPWKDALEPARANLEKAIRSVGRIEVPATGFAFSGTGWLVAPDVIVTNRHVAAVFSEKSGGEFLFKKDSATAKRMDAAIDFQEEYGINANEQFEILEVLYVAENTSTDPDIAFLKISSNTVKAGVVSTLGGSSIPLAKTLPSRGMNVAVIGYPSRSSADRTLPADVASKIFDNKYDVKRLQPGQISSDVRADLLIHDCSTLGGNSGSVLIDLKTGEAVGLHFGSSEAGNVAVPAPVILDLMERLGL